MKRKVLFLALAILLDLALCQNADDSDDNLNLDPVGENTVSSRSDNALNNKGTECVMGSGQGGVCVKYYLCDQDSKTVIEDGYSIIDIRAGTDCPVFLDVCCVLGQVLSTPEPVRRIEEENTSAVQTTPPPPRRTPGSVGPSGSGTGGSVGPSGSGTAASVGPSGSGSRGSVGKCGYSNPGANVFNVREGASPSDRVYADFGEFPWMVALLKRSDSEDSKREIYIGGGSLIHPSVVMTVAHKVQNRKANEIKIRAGEWDTNSEDELYEHQERNVAKIVVHESYFRPKLHHDVALLFLEGPVSLADAPQIGVGCLARRPPPPRAVCFSMGWGADDFSNKRVFASVLKKVKLPLVETGRCVEMLRRTRLGGNFELHPSLMCAGGEEGVDTCKGDGGSPLVCPIDAKGSRFAIYGMVAYGVSCGTKDVPAVYANVTNLYEWVGRQLSFEGLDSKSYTYM